MNKWEQFQGKSFEIVNLGRPAVFLIPAKKLKGEVGIRARQELHLFLISQFGAYSTSLVPNFGFWRDSLKRMMSDKCVVYEVSFVGKHKIPLLLEKLSELALTLKEECVYVKTGQYSCLVYPNKKSATKPRV